MEAIDTKARPQTAAPGGQGAAPFMDEEADGAFDSGEEDEFAGASKKDQRAKMKGEVYPGDEADIVYDEILAAIFEKVPPGEGDEFASVKPWLGAIKEPKVHPKPNKKEPAEKYKIDWVYGYRSEEARMNAAFNSSGHAVYATAALGVVFNYAQMKQLYFGGGKTEFSGRKQDDETGVGHSDDVTALSLSMDRELVASGQNGQCPILMVWNAVTGKKVSQKRLPKGSRLVTAVGISCNNTYIAAADAAEKIAVHIFKLAGGSGPITAVGINMKIAHLAWNPTTEDKFGTAGANHVIVCSYTGGKDAPKASQGKAGPNGKVQSMCSIAWANDASLANVYLTGGQDGKIYQWQGDEITKSYENNKGSVHSIALRVDEAAGGEVALVGGNDKTITCYPFNGQLGDKLWIVEVDAAPRSLDLFEGKILMGLKNGSLVTMPFSTDGHAQATVIMTSHCDGEEWGLDVVELEPGNIRLMTSGDDNRVLSYNVTTHRALAEGIVMPPPKKPKKAKKGFKGGASSMASTPSDQQSRSLAFCQEKNHLAVATNMGVVTIREVDWEKVDAGEAGSLDKVKKTIWKKKAKADRWIECMVYSPCAKYLGIGSHDKTVYMFDTKTYKKEIKLAGHASFITCFDWAVDSSYIRTVCGAYELLFFDAVKKKRDPSGASNTVETVWSDQTCKFGWNVNGIFPSGTDGSHINSVAMSKDQKLIACGDDYGLVNIYRNPICLIEGKGKPHQAALYRGHSEFVTRVKFSSDNKYIFSTGGQDQTTIQWKKK